MDFATSKEQGSLHQSAGGYRMMQRIGTALRPLFFLKRRFYSRTNKLGPPWKSASLSSCSSLFRGNFLARVYAPLCRLTSLLYANHGELLVAWRASYASLSRVQPVMLRSEILSLKDGHLIITNFLRG
jgi:hypothetical protein